MHSFNNIVQNQEVKKFTFLCNLVGGCNKSYSSTNKYSLLRAVERHAKSKSHFMQKEDWSKYKKTIVITEKLGDIKSKIIKMGFNKRRWVFS